VITETMAKALELEMEAVERRREEVVQELDELTAYRDQLASLRERYGNGQAATVRLDRGDVAEKAALEAAAAERKAKPRALTAGERKARNAEQLSRHQKIVELARERGEVTAKDVVRELGIHQPDANRLLRRLSTNGEGGTEPPLTLVGGTGRKGDPKRYALRNGAATQADADGARTVVERRIVEVLRNAPAALTAAMIAESAKVPRGHITGILGGLENRGVLERVDIDGELARWQLSSSGS